MLRSLMHGRRRTYVLLAACVVVVMWFMGGPSVRVVGQKRGKGLRPVPADEVLNVYDFTPDGFLELERTLIMTMYAGGDRVPIDDLDRWIVALRKYHEDGDLAVFTDPLHAELMIRIKVVCQENIAQRLPQKGTPTAAERMKKFASTCNKGSERGEYAWCIGSLIHTQTQADPMSLPRKGADLYFSPMWDRSTVSQCLPKGCAPASFLNEHGEKPCLSGSAVEGTPKGWKMLSNAAVRAPKKVGAVKEPRCLINFVYYSDLLPQAKLRTLPDVLVADVLLRAPETDPVNSTKHLVPLVHGFRNFTEWNKILRTRAETYVEELSEKII